MERHPVHDRLGGVDGVPRLAARVPGEILELVVVDDPVFEILTDPVVLGSGKQFVGIASDLVPCPAVHESECVGAECVVKVIEGPTLVKTVMRGSANGLYSLLSYNAPPIADRRIEWAAPVLWVDKRRRMR